MSCASRSFNWHIFDDTALEDTVHSRLSSQNGLIDRAQNYWVWSKMQNVFCVRTCVRMTDSQKHFQVSKHSIKLTWKDPSFLPDYNTKEGFGKATTKIVVERELLCCAMLTCANVLQQNVYIVNTEIVHTKSHNPTCDSLHFLFAHTQDEQQTFLCMQYISGMNM